MSYTVNFKEVETTGLETRLVSEVWAGLRVNEARQSARLASEIRGIFFVVKGEYLSSFSLSFVV